MIGSNRLFSNQSKRRKTEFKSVILCLKIDFVSDPTHGGGIGLIHAIHEGKD